MGRIIDISQPVSAETGAWPGDTPFSFRWTWDMSNGDSCNVSAVTASPHVGTHADAPLHFDPTGPSAGEVELERYVGPCWVADGPSDGLVGPEHLEGIDFTQYPRLLLRTRPGDSVEFPAQFVALSPAGAQALADRDVLLIGLDTPSMDPIDSTELPAHHVLSQAQIAILENLVLKDVEPGPYELLALPLKWMGLDASPVRAVLRELD